MRRTTSGAARRVEVVLATEVLAGADYASSFEVLVTDGEARSPEQWARSVFEGAPAALRWFLLVGWTVFLRLRLGPPKSPDHVLGWKIDATTAQAITLQARSTLVTVVKVLDVHERRLTVTTSVRYERRPARVLWSAIAPIHHRVEPWLITRAASPGLARSRRPRL